MNQFILLCMIGAAWATHTGNVGYPVVQPSTASSPPWFKPVYNLVLSRSVPTFGSGYKVAGTPGPFYPYVVTSVPVAGVADTGSYPNIQFSFPPIPYPAASRSYPYFPVPHTPNQAVTTAAADCPFWPIC